MSKTKTPRTAKTKTINHSEDSLSIESLKLENLAEKGKGKISSLVFGEYRNWAENEGSFPVQYNNALPNMKRTTYKAKRFLNSS